MVRGKARPVKPTDCKKRASKAEAADIGDKSRAAEAEAPAGTGADTSKTNDTKKGGEEAPAVDVEQKYATDRNIKKASMAGETKVNKVHCVPYLRIV